MRKVQFYNLQGIMSDYIYKIHKLPSNLAFTSDIEQLRRNVNKVISTFMSKPATKDICGLFWFNVTMQIKSAVSEENKKLPSYMRLMNEIDGMKKILMTERYRKA